MVKSPEAEVQLYALIGKLAGSAAENLKTTRPLLSSDVRNIADYANELRHQTAEQESLEARRI